MISLINQATVDLVKQQEAFRSTRYFDFGHYSIGYGSNATGLPENAIWTEKYAEQVLKETLEGLAKKILVLLPGVKLSSNELGALASFSYNLGIGSLASSTLLKKLKAGDKKGAAEEFLKWNKAKVNGKRVPLAGLTKRRNLERTLFLTKDK